MHAENITLFQESEDLETMTPELRRRVGVPQVSTDLTSAGAGEGGEATTRLGDSTVSETDTSVPSSGGLGASQPSRKDGKCKLLYTCACGFDKCVIVLYQLQLFNQNSAVLVRHPFFSKERYKMCLESVCYIIMTVVFLQHDCNICGQTFCGSCSVKVKRAALGVTCE